MDDALPLYLLMAYAKNQQADLASEELAVLEAFVVRIKALRREH